MKLTMLEIIQSVGTLQKLVTVQLPVKVSYRLNKNLRKISEEIVDYEKTREQLLQKYGTGDGGIPEENLAEAEAELSKLLAEEVEIDIMQISPEDMGDTTMSIQEVNLVNYLFDENAPPA